MNTLYCIRNNETGKEYDVSTTSMILLRFFYPISYLIYGIIIVLASSMLELQYETVTFVLVAAYAFEILLRFSGRFSGVMALYTIFTYALLIKTWAEIIKDVDNHIVFNDVVKDLHNEIEFQKLRRKGKITPTS